MSVLGRASWIVLPAALAAGSIPLWLYRGSDRSPEGPAHELLDDAAGLMSPPQRETVRRYHEFLLRDHDVDYRVQTLRAADDIDEYAVRRYEELGVGEPSEAGRGLLLVIDAGRDRVRLEVGYSLEGVFPDAFVSYIEHDQMVPFFGEDRVADGILAATELLITRIQNAKEKAGYENEPWMAGSGGAGATAPARLGSDRVPVRHGAEVEAEDSPEASLRAYLGAMEKGNASPRLDLYTAETRRMLEGHVMTPAQMQTLIRTYDECEAEPTRYDPDRSHAVIRYPWSERRCAPWFFAREGEVWRLDLTMMRSAIRFGRGNEWHFTPGAGHPYEFAFQDWSFDRRGFPQPG